SGSRRHTRSKRDWSSDVCSSDLIAISLGERGVLDRAGGAAAVPGALRAGVLRVRLARLAVHALLPVRALLAALAVAGGPGEVVPAAVGRVVRLVGRPDGAPVGGLVEGRGEIGSA